MEQQLRTSNLIADILLKLPTAPVKVDEVRIGPFLTAVRPDKEALKKLGVEHELGLAATIAPYRPGMKKAIRRIGGLEGNTAQELADLLNSESLLESTVGMAAVNSLLEVPGPKYEETHAMDLVFDKGRGQKVAVIGHFPFVDKLRPEVDELFVLELKGFPGDLPADRASEIMPECSLIVLTATVLINKTFHQVLPLCRGAFTIMMGPSTPASPALFDYGVDVLAGSSAFEADFAIKAVSQGATYRDLGAVKKWSWIKPD